MAKSKAAMELKRQSVLVVKKKFPEITIKQLALQHGVTSSAVKKWIAKANAPNELRAAKIKSILSVLDKKPNTTMKELAEQHGITAATVKVWLKKIKEEC